jgi:hypothetical protein
MFYESTLVELTVRTVRYLNRLVGETVKILGTKEPHGHCSSVP